MINVLLVDDHPALRAGLMTVLRTEPGIVPVGTASCPEDLWPEFNRTRPDLVVLDYHLPGTDGLAVCRLLKRVIPAPAVLLYSAYADAALTIPAILAGADGIVHKGVPARELCESIRRVAAGADALPAVSPPLLEAAAHALDDEDRPILGMLVNRIPAKDIAGALGLSPVDLRARIARMLARLKVPVHRVPPPQPGRAAADL